MTDALSAKFAALADPTRRAILARLALGEATLSELSKPFDMTVPAVAKHIKVLEDVGLVSRGKRAQMKPVRLEPAALKEPAEWLEKYRRFWVGSFDRLESLLAQKKPRKGK